MIYQFTKLSISDKKLSNFLYAIFMTKAELHSYHHLNLERFNRKQNSGHMVNVIIKISEDKVEEFEQLSGVKLQTSKDFQGEMRLN